MKTRKLIWLTFGFVEDFVCPSIIHSSPLSLDRKCQFSSLKPSHHYMVCYSMIQTRSIKRTRIDVRCKAIQNFFVSLIPWCSISPKSEKLKFCLGFDLKQKITKICSGETVLNVLFFTLNTHPVVLQNYLNKTQNPQLSLQKCGPTEIVYILEEGRYEIVSVNENWPSKHESRL